MRIVPLFARFASDKRVIVPASRYLPKWLWALPPALQFISNRRVWLSLLSLPVHGWHIQQILKIAGVLNAPEQRVCILDSDNLFFREFDVGQYAGAEKTPLFVTRKGIDADHPLHVLWLRTVDQLLGIKERSFPADDYVGNALVWDKDTARAMTDAIKSATGLNWALALCRKKKFSEYLHVRKFRRELARATGRPPGHRRQHRGLALGRYPPRPSGNRSDDARRFARAGRALHPVLFVDLDRRHPRRVPPEFARPSRSEPVSRSHGRRGRIRDA